MLRFLAFPDLQQFSAHKLMLPPLVLVIQHEQNGQLIRNGNRLLNRCCFGTSLKKKSEISTSIANGHARFYERSSLSSFTVC